MRTTGKYVHFSLPDFQNSYKVYSLNEETKQFKEAFFGTKKKEEDDSDSTDDDSEADSNTQIIDLPNKDQIKFIDAVFSEDLVVLLLRDKGDQLAQIYTNDADFKLIDTIRDG